MHSGLCTLIGVREKPGGREKAKRGKKEREGEELPGGSCPRPT